MTAQQFFYVAFLSQVFIISIFIPGTIVRRMNFVLEHFPPETHPRLYPRPIEYYEGKRRVYRSINLLIALAGLAALVSMAVVHYDVDLAKGVAFGFFMTQVAPMLWLEHALRRELKLMRELDTSRTRVAELNPRRLFDVMSPGLFWVVVAVYLAFWVFIAWFRQFGYPWFGGFLNNLIITGMNLFFVAVLAWHMFGKKLNPHQSAADRLAYIRRLAVVLGFISIAATSYAVLTITLSAADAHELKPAARSVYFQIIALASFYSYRIESMNFDVYREDARVA